jgi:hypothetical protein
VTTAANLTWMYGWREDANKHANIIDSFVMECWFGRVFANLLGWGRDEETQL